MTPCSCIPGYCAREEGALPAKSRRTLCRSKVVVPRHRPTLDFNMASVILAPIFMKRVYEPIEDEK